MGRSIQTVAYGDGEFSGYLVQVDRAVAQGPLPAVVVLHEAWGITPHIESVAGRFADAGYAVLAPDLYAKRGIRPTPLARERMAELLDFVNANGPAVFRDAGARAKALRTLADEQAARLQESLDAVFGALREPARHVPALLAATKFLRQQNQSTRGSRIASVGYCMGGGLSALFACHDPELACACIYYGSPPPPDRIPAIAATVYGFYGSQRQAPRRRRSCFCRGHEGGGQGVRAPHLRGRRSRILQRRPTDLPRRGVARRLRSHDRRVSTASGGVMPSPFPAGHPETGATKNGCRSEKNVRGRRPRPSNEKDAEGGPPRGQAQGD